MLAPRPPAAGKGTRERPPFAEFPGFRQQARGWADAHPTQAHAACFNGPISRIPQFTTFQPLSINRSIGACMRPDVRRPWGRAWWSDSSAPLSPLRPLLMFPSHLSWWLREDDASSWSASACQTSSSSLSSRPPRFVNPSPAAFSDLAGEANLQRGSY